MENTHHLPMVKIKSRQPTVEERLQGECLTPEILLMPNNLPLAAMKFTCLHVTDWSDRKVYVKLMDVKYYHLEDSYAIELDPTVDPANANNVLEGSILPEDLYRHYKNVYDHLREYVQQRKNSLDK